VEVAVRPPQIQQVLANGYTHLQILGEKGYGKTTLLLSMAAEKRLSGYQVTYEYIPEDGRTFQTSLHSLDYFFLDEAQRLNKSEHKRLLNPAPTTHFVLATHENLAAMFDADNLPLTTVELGDIGPDHLEAVLNKRLNYFSLSGVTPAPFSEESISYLWHKFGRNIRAAEQYLYEQFQEKVNGSSPS